MNRTTALLQVPQRVRHRLAALERDEHAGAAALDAAGVRGKAVEHAIDHAGAAGVGEELAVIADQRPRGREKHEPLLAGAGRAHLDQLGAAPAQLLDHRSCERLVDVDHDLLDRLERLAGRGSVRSSTRGRPIDELVALAAHGLDQHRELQLAATGDLEAVARLRLAHPDRDVALGLAPQPLPDQARGDVAAVVAGERRIVGREGHRERRRVDRLRRQRRLDLEIAERVRDGGAIEARRAPRCRRPAPPPARPAPGPRNASTLVTRVCSIGAPSRPSALSVAFGRMRSGFDPAGQQAAEVRVALERGRQHDEGSVRGDPRRRDVAADQLEQGRHAALARRRRGPAVAQPSRAEANKVGKSSCAIARAERGEQIEHLVVHGVRALVGPVDLVDHHDRAQARGGAPCRARTWSAASGLRRRRPAAARRRPSTGCARPRRRSRRGPGCRRC